MINCPKCNVVLSDDTKICPYCNTRIGSNGIVLPKKVFEIFLFVVFGVPFISMLCIMLLVVGLVTLSDITTSQPVETTIDGGIIKEDGSVVYSHKLTLDKLYELANWGEDLTWEHFGIYDYADLKYDKRTGYQVITYNIKDQCHTRKFVISGIKDQKPDSMLFYSSYRDSFGTEIRDTKEFEKAKKALKFDVCHSTY